MSFTGTTVGRSNGLLIRNADRFRYGWTLLSYHYAYKVLKHVGMLDFAMKHDLAMLDLGGLEHCALGPDQDQKLLAVQNLSISE